MVVEVDQVDTSECDPGHAPVAAGSTSEALANQFANNGLTVREALAPVNAFDYDGYKLVVEVPAGCADEPAWTGGEFQGRHYQAAGQIVEYWFLDVEDTTVMVEATWFPGSSPEEDVAELRKVLDSLVVTPWARRSPITGPLTGFDQW